MENTHFAKVLVQALTLGALNSATMRKARHCALQIFVTARQLANMWERRSRATSHCHKTKSNWLRMLRRMVQSRLQWVCLLVQCGSPTPVAYSLELNVEHHPQIMECCWLASTK